MIERRNDAAALAAVLYDEAAEWLRLASWAYAAGEDATGDALLRQAALRLRARASLGTDPA